MKFNYLRFHYCKLRWIFKKKNVKVFQAQHDATGDRTVTHNLDAFNDNAVFGMSGRMGLLIYPVVAFYRNALDANMLIVGCRTEDDLYWLKGYGYKNVQGYDLISYSNDVILGDFHQCQLADNSYDVVMLGWMITYTKNPELIISEAKRILKSGGLLCVGLDHCHRAIRQEADSPAANELNSAADLVTLIDAEVIFLHEHNYSDGDNCAVVFRIVK